jgi:DNA-binding transcriptional LysR family regulator
MPLAQHPHTPPDWVKFRRKRGWRTGVRNFFDIVAPIESVANGLLPRIIAEYHIARPAIELRVREGVHGAVLEDIRSGVADLGITFVDELPDTIAMVPLGREVFHAVMPRQHRLAPSRGVTMKQIGREPPCLVAQRFPDPPDHRCRGIQAGHNRRRSRKPRTAILVVSWAVLRTELRYRHDYEEVQAVLRRTRL